MKKMNAIFSVIISVFFTHCAIAGTTQSPKNTTPPSSYTSPQHLNTVVAVVNNEIITQDELNAALSQASNQLAASQSPNAIDQNKLKKMVLNQLIDQKLQLELAKQANIKISDQQVMQAIQHVAEANHLTVAELKERLSQEGMSFSAYQKLIHRQLLVHQVQQNAIASTITVTNQDIQKVRAQYQAQTNGQQKFHIIDLLASTKQQAQQFQARLKKGEDFSKLAPNQTKNLGWQTTNTLPSIFLAQLAHMKTGDISTVIQAPNGFHIIKLVGVKGNTATLSTAQLRNYAYQMKFQMAAKKWLATVRKTAYIKITP